MRLKNYPTPKFVRDHVSDEYFQSILANKPTDPVAVATYTGTATPQVLLAWATLLEAVKGAYTSGNVSCMDSLRITRDPTLEEREEAAIAEIRSSMYYHPQDFAAITSDLMTDE